MKFLCEKEVSSHRIISSKCRSGFLRSSSPSTSGKTGETLNSTLTKKNKAHLWNSCDAMLLPVCRRVPRGDGNYDRFTTTRLYGEVFVNAGSTAPRPTHLASQHPKWHTLALGARRMGGTSVRGWTKGGWVVIIQWNKLVMSAR